MCNFFHFRLSLNFVTLILKVNINRFEFFKKKKKIECICQFLQVWLKHSWISNKVWSKLNHFHQIFNQPVMISDRIFNDTHDSWDSLILESFFFFKKKSNMEYIRTPSYTKLKIKRSIILKFEDLLDKENVKLYI